MAPMTGPHTRFSQVGVRVRGDLEASLYAGLGELRRQGHRPLPGGTAGEEDGEEETGAGEAPPTGHARPQGGPTLADRIDEPSSVGHRPSSRQVEALGNDPTTPPRSWAGWEHGNWDLWQFAFRPGSGPAAY